MAPKMRNGQIDLHNYKRRLERAIQFLNGHPKASRKNKQKILEFLERLKAVNARDWAEWTKDNYRVAVKRFWRWMKGLEKGKDPIETEWIKIGKAESKPILPEDLLPRASLLTGFPLLSSVGGSTGRLFFFQRNILGNSTPLLQQSFEYVLCQCLSGVCRSSFFQGFSPLRGSYRL